MLYSTKAPCNIVLIGTSVPPVKLYVTEFIVLVNAVVGIEVSIVVEPSKCWSTHVSWKLNFHPTFGG